MSMEREALNQPEMPPSEPRMWPGKRLREAREAMQMSREEAARHLHQDVAIITALEDDDYARLPGQTYVLGYLRSYARLLKLPQNEIVEAVQVEQVETTDLLPENVDRGKPVMLDTGRSYTWLYILLIILAIALVGWFLLGDDSLDISATMKPLLQHFLHYA